MLLNEYREQMTTNYLGSNDDEKQTAEGNVDDVLNFHFGDIILR